MKNEYILKNLREKYIELQEEIARRNAEIRAKYRALEKAEKEEEKEKLEKIFAWEFNMARESGVKRYELERYVLGSNRGDRYKKYVELGGGSLRKLVSADEKIELLREAEEKRFEEMGVRHVSGNRYMWTVNGVEYPVDLLWRDRAWIAFPFEDAFGKMREQGIGLKEAKEKGAEIARAFGVEEPED